MGGRLDTLLKVIAGIVFGILIGALIGLGVAKPMECNASRAYAIELDGFRRYEFDKTLKAQAVVYETGIRLLRKRLTTYERLSTNGIR